MNDKINLAKKRLNERWLHNGACNTCNYHGLLSEYDIDDYDIESAIDDYKGYLELPCLNDNYHRGVKIYIGEKLDPTIQQLIDAGLATMKETKS